jgi:hypothetical protein
MGTLIVFLPHYTRFPYATVLEMAEGQGGL